MNDFLVSVDESLDPERLDRLVSSETFALSEPLWSVRDIPNKKGWKGMNIRRLAKAVLNRFPALWPYARWFYDHLFLSRKLAMVDMRQEQVQSHASVLEQRIAQLESTLAEERKRHEALQQRYERLEALIRHVACQNEERGTHVSSAEHSTSVERLDELADRARMDGFYQSLEAAFRGDEAHVRHYQQVYLDYLSSAPSDRPVLDIGCGRGEWLEVLREAGWTVQGLDRSPLMVARCEEKGLPVVQGEALQYLADQPEDYFAAITALHVVEHLPFETLFTLLEHLYRVLAPEGIVILETPNPENLQVGAHTFWLDPTHQKPLPPALLAHLARYVGFDIVDIARFHPYPEPEDGAEADSMAMTMIRRHLLGPQDYALILTKAAASS